MARGGGTAIGGGGEEVAGGGAGGVANTASDRSPSKPYAAYAVGIHSIDALEKVDAASIKDSIVALENVEEATQ